MTLAFQIWSFAFIVQESSSILQWKLFPKSKTYLNVTALNTHFHIVISLHCIEYVLQLQGILNNEVKKIHWPLPFTLSDEKSFSILISIINHNIVP